MEKETEITDMFNIVLVNPEIPPKHRKYFPHLRRYWHKAPSHTPPRL